MKLETKSSTSTTKISQLFHDFKPLSSLCFDAKRIWLDVASLVSRAYALQRVDIDDI
ncbi:hypothetical protein BCV72DRAFT_320601, partial [Rhizopus microsporus var. microsporus]